MSFQHHPGTRPLRRLLCASPGPDPYVQQHPTQAGAGPHHTRHLAGRSLFPAAERWYGLNPTRWILLGLLLPLGCAPVTDELLPPANASQRFPIQPAETCRTCHPTQYAQWQGSLMAYMAVSPFFNGLEISIQELVGRHRDLCPDGAGVLRRADENLSESCINPVQVDFGDGSKTPIDLKITGAGGEHWCVNCHIMAENTYRQFIPSQESTPLVPGVPTWKKSDADSRRPLVELLRHQTSPSLKGTVVEGTEGRTMLQGATCDACHQVVHAVASTQTSLEADAGGSAVLNDTLSLGNYSGNPFWTSFFDVETGADPSPCVQTRIDGQRLSEVGEPCKQLFREEAEEGDGISNSGYAIDVRAVPTGQDPRSAGSWKFGPKLDSSPVFSPFHQSSHAPVQLGSPVQAAVRDIDSRYGIPGDANNADYFKTSEYCGTCHDVRIIGTDARRHVQCIPGSSPSDCFTDALAGEPQPQFEAHKRLRDAYSEWRRSDYARSRAAASTPPEATKTTIDSLRQGDSVVTCQDCHMSVYPVHFSTGTQALSDDCETLAVSALPSGMKAFEDKLLELSSRADATATLVKPGCYPLAKAADDPTLAERPPTRRVSTHYFTGADVPIEPLFNTDQFTNTFNNDVDVDDHGMISSLLQRRDLLLKRSVSMTLPSQTLTPTANGSTVELPLQLLLENVGAGHRIPAGFTQEREVWVELVVTDLASAPASFQCGQDAMLERVQESDAYPRVSRCVSQLRFSERLDDDCAALIGQTPINASSLETALEIERASLGILAHVGALIDQDHDELVIGNGPGLHLLAPAGIGVPVLSVEDRLDYEALLALFDPETGLLLSSLSEGLRLGDNQLLLLDRQSSGQDVFYTPLLLPEAVLGEVRLVERADGRIVDEDLTDKRFARIRINDDFFDGSGGGLIATYAADVFDGPDKPQITSSVIGADGKSVAVEQEGLINFQNGFLTCVACCPAGSVFAAPSAGGASTCVTVDAQGQRVALDPALIPIDRERGTCCRGDFDASTGLCAEDRETFPKAWNMVQGQIDLEDGQCFSNLVDDAGKDLFSQETLRPGKFLEVFSPIEGLTADSGAFKAADAILNERSLLPGVPYTFSNRIQLSRAPQGELCIEARLNFRAFPPYELRMFAGRELLRYASRQRSAPTMSMGMVDRLDVVVMGLDTLSCVKSGSQWTCARPQAF